MFQYFLIFLVTFLLFYIVVSTVKPKKFPPGPKWYPFFGSSIKLHSMTVKHGSQYKAFLELSKEYSTNILGLNLGSELLVVLSGEKNIREGLYSDAFEGRPDNFFVRMRSFGTRAGISLADGPLWKIHRRFTMTHLRNAGFGKGPMERDIQCASQDLVEWIREQDGRPIYPKDFLPLAVMNILWKCAAGEKIKAEKWGYLQGLLQKRAKVFNLAGGMLNRVPWTRFLLPGYTGYSTLVEVNKQISDIIEETIWKHKNGEVGEHDLINAFLGEMANNKDTFTEDQLKMICIDLLLAGSATTAHAMEFAIMQVLIDEKVQKKIHAEIDLVLRGNKPCWEDNSRLVYTSAYLLELQRLYTIIPLAGPRRILKEIEIDGYVIPRNTTVLMTTGEIHVDPELWEDPYSFKPERFIDENGSIKNSEHLYTFGLGRRRCPGDALARMFIFIVFTSLMQQFTITNPEDRPPCNEPDIGLFSSPKRYSAIFKHRKLK